MPADKIPSNAIGNGGAGGLNPYGQKNCHNAIALPQISRYLADASTNFGLVATVAGLMV
jgi:hypothetical protein